MNQAKFTMNALLVITIIFSAIGLFFTVRLYNMAGVLYITNDNYPIEGTDLFIHYGSRETDGLYQGTQASNELKVPGTFGVEWGLAATDDRLYLNEYFTTDVGLLLCDFVQIDRRTYEETTIAENTILRGRCASGELVCIGGCMLPVNAPEDNSLCKLYAMSSGQLRQGHLIIDERLHNVSICSDASIPAFESMDLSFLLIDEADLMPCQVLESLLDRARDTGIPVILAYDPHHLLLGDAPGEARAEAAPGGAHPEAATGTPQPEPAPGTPHPEPAPGPSAQTIALISRRASLALAFSGNIRVNRPVYNFLRTLLHPKDRAGRPDYSGIDVLCSKSPQETALLAGYYRARGYTRVDFSREAREEIAPEYGRVLLVLDSSFYYDEALFLHAVTQEEGRLKFLYEVLSRTRENLCLIVEGNPSLFLKVLQIRLYA